MNYKRISKERFVILDYWFPIQSIFPGIIFRKNWKWKYILSSKSSFFQCKSTFFCYIFGVIKLQHLRGLRQCAYFKKLRKIQTYAFWASALSLYHKARETRNICWATVVAFMLASMTQILPRLACCIYKVKCVLHPLIIGSAESNPWS